MVQPPSAPRTGRLNFFQGQTVPVVDIHVKQADGGIARHHRPPQAPSGPRSCAPAQATQRHDPMRGSSASDQAIMN